MARCRTKPYYGFSRKGTQSALLHTPQEPFKALFTRLQAIDDERYKKLMGKRDKYMTVKTGDLKAKKGIIEVKKTSAEANKRSEAKIKDKAETQGRLTP